MLLLAPRNFLSDTGKVGPERGVTVWDTPVVITSLLAKPTFISRLPAPRFWISVGTDKAPRRQESVSLFASASPVWSLNVQVTSPDTTEHCGVPYPFCGAQMEHSELCDDKEKLS